MYLRQAAEKQGIILTDRMIEQFDIYRDFLLEKNRDIDLTNITEREEVDKKHFLDSLSPSRALGRSFSGRLVDIGTGAGFPGIPLKILYPEMELLLIDSLRKRVNFLNELIDILSLSKTKAIHTRVEDYFIAGNEERESYDIAISRALAPLPALLEYMLPAVKISGKAIAMKGPALSEELDQSFKSMEILGGVLEQVDSFIWTEDKYERNNVIVRKMKACPEKYPRRGAKIRKNPLI